MDASLTKHGYNVERRKMYIENRKHRSIQLGTISKAPSTSNGHNPFSKGRTTLKTENDNPVKRSKNTTPSASTEKSKNRPNSTRVPSA